MRARTITALVVTVGALFFVLISAQNLVENVDASEIVVIQAPVSGNLTFHTSQGLKWQGFGTVTVYPKRGHYQFDGQSITIDGTTEVGARITFNDGAVSALAGSVQFDYPLDNNSLERIHTTYGSHEALANQLVEVVVDKSIYLTGTLLSSRESYSERRADMISWAEDQIQLGAYRTQQVNVEEIDPLSGEIRSTVVAEIMLGPDGLPIRQEQAQLAQFGITPRNFAPNDVIYPARVREQIATQQENIMAVETKIVEARQAEQETITVEQQGRALAATARWEQEALKATAVTAAEMRRDVATLDQEAASFERQANILRGQGEAERKRLVMEADGALQPKLDAWIEAQRVYADAISKYQGAWVPQVIMGGDGKASAPGSGATDLIDLLTVKTASELGLDLKMRAKGQQR